jgi:hypothetical protein
MAFKGTTIKKVNYGRLLLPVGKRSMVENFTCSSSLDQLPGGQYTRVSLSKVNNSTNILYITKLVFLVSIRTRRSGEKTQTLKML